MEYTEKMPHNWMISNPMGSEKAAKRAPHTPEEIHKAMNSWELAPKGLAGFGTTEDGF